MMCQASLHHDKTNVLCTLPVFHPDRHFQSESSLSEVWIIEVRVLQNPEGGDIVFKRGANRPAASLCLTSVGKLLE
jgi:hypothetical protein